MNVKELRTHADQTISNLKDHGKFPKENNLYDYKLELNFYDLTEPLEIFLRNFAKDILSFSNGNGGIIILGIKEDQALGTLEDIGLTSGSCDLLSKIDVSRVSQKFEKICKVGIDLDLQSFQLGTRIFYSLLIGKQNNVLIPINDFPEYRLIKGDITYRASGKNETANHSAQDFNRFLQIKANEKNKEFMEIWSKLLPEIFDINPREILIINPKHNRVYGFNGKDNVLSSSDIEIDKSENGVFNVILNAISAGEIGKISDVEGKPLYKIVGEIKSLAPRAFIYLSTLATKAQEKSIYKFTYNHLKAVIFHLGWVNSATFKVENPPEGTVVESFGNYIWIETLDSRKRVVFSDQCIEEILEIIHKPDLHQTLFSRMLDLQHQINA